MIDHIESSISDNDYELIKLGEEKESVGLNEYTVKILENIVDELEDIEYSYCSAMDCLEEDIEKFQSETSLVAKDITRLVWDLLKYKRDDIFGWDSEIMVWLEFNRHVGGVIESYFERKLP